MFGDAMNHHPLRPGWDEAIGHSRPPENPTQRYDNETWRPWIYIWISCFFHDRIVTASALVWMSNALTFPLSTSQIHSVRIGIVLQAVDRAFLITTVIIKLTESATTAQDISRLLRVANLQSKNSNLMPTYRSSGGNYFRGRRNVGLEGRPA